MGLAWFPITSSWNTACYIRGLIHGIGRGVPNAGNCSVAIFTALADMFADIILTAGFLGAFWNLVVITVVLMIYKDRHHKESTYAKVHGSIARGCTAISSPI